MQALNIPVLAIITLGFFFFSCEQNEVFPSDYYDCSFDFSDSSSIHPKSAVFQEILDSNRREGLVGAVLLVKDENGLWIGAAGQADVESGVEVRPCHSFFIGSISKSFTAAAVFSYIDEGLLSLDDPINQWIPRSLTDEFANGNDARIRHLLSHTSGIPDYYTTAFELDRFNRVDNMFSKEAVLEYIYGKSSVSGVGEEYSYSNTNYLLLAILLEEATGLSLAEIYQRRVFEPLNLSSGYYSETQRIPPGVVKGYAELYEGGNFVESEFLYLDELGIGGDGGIAMNAYHTGRFFERLSKGDLVSPAALQQMTDWFPLPDPITDGPVRFFENGFGLERYQTDYGNALGHEGGIDGYAALALYFPERDATLVLLTNTFGTSDGRKAIYEEILQQMFEQ